MRSFTAPPTLDVPAQGRLTDDVLVHLRERVPIYETSSPEQVAWILGDSGAVACVVETAEHLARVMATRDALDDLVHVWSIADGGVGTLGSLGAEVDDHVLEDRRTRVHPGSTATLIYTSGTTGRPKGCVLTHADFMVELG